MFAWVQAYRWDTSRFASRLQGWAAPTATPRKVRLYAVAVGRFVEGLQHPGEPELADARSEYFDIAEGIADGVRTPNELRDAITAMADWDEFTQSVYGDFPVFPFFDPPIRETVGVIGCGRLSPGAFSDFDNETRLSLLRCIFGNPFRPVAFDPAWRTSAAVALAARMYDTRDFGPMPILADALQEAGCDNAAVLDHCRGPGPHVRGCWVVDHVLGKA